MVWLSSGCSLSLYEVFRLFPFPAYCQDSYKSLISLRYLSNWDWNRADIYFKRENKPQTLSVKWGKKGSRNYWIICFYLNYVVRLFFLKKSFFFKPRDLSWCQTADKTYPKIPRQCLEQWYFTHAPKTPIKKHMWRVESILFSLCGLCSCAWTSQSPEE